MKTIRFLFLIAFTFNVCYAQNTTKELGFSISPGISGFRIAHADGIYANNKYKNKFSPDAKLSFGINKKHLKFGASLGIEVLKNELTSTTDSFSSIDSNNLITNYYVGLHYYSIYSRYSFVLSPYFLWSLSESDKNGMFLGLQISVCHPFRFMEHNTLDFTAIYDDSDTTFSYTPSSNQNKFNLSIAGKFGYQLLLSSNVSLRASFLYLQYFTAASKKSEYTTSRFYYYRYGLEVGVFISI